MPGGWESASNRYALLLAGIIAVFTTVVFGIRIARFAQRGGHSPAEMAEMAEMAARTYHGRYLTAADFEHGIAETEALSQQARAVRLALRELPG